MKKIKGHVKMALVLLPFSVTPNYFFHPSGSTTSLPVENPGSSAYRLPKELKNLRNQQDDGEGHLGATWGSSKLWRNILLVGG